MICIFGKQDLILETVSSIALGTTFSLLIKNQVKHVLLAFTRGILKIILGWFRMDNREGESGQRSKCNLHIQKAMCFGMLGVHSGSKLCYLHNVCCFL